MAKFCSNCGHRLQDGDKFCSECGATVGAPAFAPGAPVYAPAQAVAYETCEIKWRRRWSWPIYRFVFYAEAIGPRGMYDAGESPVVSNVRSLVSFGASMHKLHPYVQRLVTQLTAQGWEPVSDKGIAWWSYRFRRVLR